MSRVLILLAGAGAAIGLFAPEEPQPQLRIVTDSEASRAAGGSAPGNGFATLIDRADDGHFYVTAQVNNRPLRFLIDTGATGIALTPADAQAAGLFVDPAQSEIVGSGVSGPVSGNRVTLDSVQIEGKTVHAIPAVVLGEGLGVSLLGQSFLSRYGNVTIAGDRMELR